MLGQQGRPILALLLFFVSLVVFHRETAFLFEGDPKLIAEVTENFNHGVVQRPEALENHGFVAGPKGWSLPPHTSGRLIYRSPQPIGPEGAVSLVLFFYRPSHEVTNALKLSLDAGRTFTTIARNVHFLGSRIDLTPYLPSDGVFLLLFEATNEAASPLLVLDKMDLRVFEGRPPMPPSPLLMTLAFLAFSLAIILLTPTWKQALPLLFILGVGFFIRYLNIERVLYSTLDPDAQLYRALIERMTLFGENGFYSANFSIREPFFLLVTKAFFLFFGPSDTHLRFISFFLSLVTILLSYRLARDLFGEGLGLLAALAMALNVPLMIESGRGLRLELEMVLLLLFCHVGFVKQGMKPISRFLLLGLLGGLIVLTRSSYLPGLALLMGASAVTHERRLKRIALMGSLSVLLMVLLLAPHQFMIYNRHGDLFWDTNLHTRWYANLEFGGKPGFPSREELEKNAYAGPKLTYAQYLFTLHTPAEAMIGTLRGFVKIAGGMNLVGYRGPVAALLGFDPGWVDHLVTAIGALGLLVALLSPGFRWLPLTFLALTFPVAFLYDKGLTEPYRLTMQAFSFFLLSGLLAVRYGLKVGRERSGQILARPLPSSSPEVSMDGKSGKDQEWPMRERWILLAILALAVGLRFYRITDLGLTHWDEGLYASAGRLLTYQGFQALPALRLIEAPPLFSILAGLVQGLFGRADWPTIAVSAAAGTVTVYLLYVLGKKLSGPEAGLFAAATVAFSTYHVIYSRMALTEATFILFALLTLLWFHTALTEDSLRHSLLAGVAAGLMLNTKYAGSFVLTPLVLVGVLRLGAPLVARWKVSEEKGEEPFGWRPKVIGLSLFLLVGVGLFIPWVLFVAARSGTEQLVSRPVGFTALATGGLVATPPTLILAYFLRWTSPAFLLFTLIGASLALARRRLSDGLLMAYLLIYSLGVMVYLSYPRLALPLLPALALLAGKGLKALLDVARGKILKTVILVVASLTALDLLQRSVPLLAITTDGYRRAAELLETAPKGLLIFEKMQSHFRFYTSRPLHLADHPKVRLALAQEGTKYFFVDQTLTWEAFPERLFEQNRDRLKLIAKLPNPTYEIVYLQPASLEKMRRLANNEIPDEYRYIFVYRTDQPLVLPD
ncbi:MAG: glycosyltransferase family 39 protein [candidate division NC10 bacterium]|nr:glycosyltransferase family 39 protein [candidate division NC10 bacterium]